MASSVHASATLLYELYGFGGSHLISAGVLRWLAR
jgi:hypothetical protein